MNDVDVTKRRVPISNLIGAAFGGLWGAAGSLAFSGTARYLLLFAAGVITVGILVQIIRASVPTASQNTMFHSPSYVIAVVLEVVALAAAGTVLPRYGLQRYMPQVAGIIVGLHFLGLWRASRSTRFLWISAGMCVVSATALFLPPSATGVKVGDVVTGFGNAVVLWWGASLF